MAQCEDKPNLIEVRKYSPFRPQAIKNLILKRPLLLSSFDNSARDPEPKKNPMLVGTESYVEHRRSFSIQTSLKLSRNVLKGFFQPTSEKVLMTAFNTTNQRAKISSRITIHGTHSISKRSCGIELSKQENLFLLQQQLPETPESYQLATSVKLNLMGGPSQQSPLDTSPQTPKVVKVRNYSIEIPPRASERSIKSGLGSPAKKETEFVPERQPTAQTRMQELKKPEGIGKTQAKKPSVAMSTPSSKRSEKEGFSPWPQRWVPLALKLERQQTCPSEGSQGERPRMPSRNKEPQPPKQRPSDSVQDMHMSRSPSLGGVHRALVTQKSILVTAGSRADSWAGTVRTADMNRPSMLSPFFKKEKKRVRFHPLKTLHQ